MARPCAVIVVLIAAGGAQVSRAQEDLAAAFERLLVIDGEEYVGARQEFLGMPQARDYLERLRGQHLDWKRDVLAGTCLLLLEQARELESLIKDEQLIGGFSDDLVRSLDRGDYRWAGDLQARWLLRRAMELGIRGDLLSSYLTERLFKNYQHPGWGAHVDSLYSRSTDQDIRLVGKRISKEESRLWRVVAIQCLRVIGTPEQIPPLVAVALGSEDAPSRELALRALAFLQDRPAKGTRIPARDGRGFFGVGGGPPQHEWQKRDVVFTDGQMQTLWQALVVSLQVDSSQAVRIAAAESLGRNPRFVPAIPFLKTAIAEMLQDEVRAAAERSLATLESVAARQAEQQ
jgi:hypothetical protein